MTARRAIGPGQAVLWVILAWRAGFATDVLATESLCATALPNHLLAQERFAGGVVAFQPVKQADEGAEIEVVYYRPDDDCLPVTIDSYGINGGPPELEASFVYPIQGEFNLFTVVSWPLSHRGLGMRGRYYGVYAYHQSGEALALNTFVTHNPELSSGIVGTYQGEESTFEGTTEQGLISLLGSQGKWSWQAACNPSGKQYELAACAHVEQIEAEEELNAVRQLLLRVYTDFPDELADMLARFDEAQRVWRLQLQNDLASLFPLPPGEDPTIVYGSSYSMRYAYAQAFLVRQRAEFLRSVWLPAHVGSVDAIER